MASDLNVMLGKPTPTGQTRQVPVYTVVVSGSWLDNNGVRRSGTRTMTWPDCLEDAAVTASEKMDILTDIALLVARKKLGIDT